jgi:RNA polymerase sigma-70 factor (ECF subfamily)
MANTRSGAEIAQLVAEHHQAVYRYAFRLTGAVQDAEDLTQQVFLTAQRKLGQLRNINAAESWLFSILRNRFLKERQRQRPALAADLAVNVELIPTDPPSEEIDQARLQDALNRLPNHFRLVVVMFYFQQCSYREIAEELEMPIGTVMSRLSRAKDCLRSLWFEPERKPPRPAPHGGRAKVVS